MNNKLPKLKKRINDFLSSEEGKVTKGAAAKVATFVILAGTMAGEALVGVGVAMLVGLGITGRSADYAGADFVSLLSLCIVFVLFARATRARA